MTDGQSTDSTDRTALDLFCGAGGASLGLRQAGFQVTGIDTSEHALTTHDRNLSGETIHHDVADIDTSLVPAVVDHIHASWPCKGYSTAGEMNPKDERNKLIWPVLDWVEAVGPDSITLENVPESMSPKFAQALRSRFGKLGYTVTWNVLDAADYGVPQHRERLIAIAAKDVDPSLPTPTHGSRGQRTLIGGKLKARRTVGDVIDGLASDGGDIANQTTPNHSEKVTARFDRLGSGQRVCDLVNSGTNKQCQIRLDPNLPSPTVTGGESDLIHPYQNRTLSVREMARIQSFPDWFEFRGPRTSGGKRRQEVTCQAEQVGNAVPPLLMKKIAFHVREIIQPLHTDTGKEVSDR